jgi:hypothetical protein
MRYCFFVKYTFSPDNIVYHLLVTVMFLFLMIIAAVN